MIKILSELGAEGNFLNLRGYSLKTHNRELPGLSTLTAVGQVQPLVRELGSLQAMREAKKQKPYSKYNSKIKKNFIPEIGNETKMPALIISDQYPAGHPNR